LKATAAKIAIIAVHHHTTTDKEACIGSLRGNRQGGLHRIPEGKLEASRVVPLRDLDSGKQCRERGCFEKQRA